jgi:hypothetical protein
MSAINPREGLLVGIIRRQDYSNVQIVAGRTAMAADVGDKGTWHRSSYCTPGKNCVEVSHAGNGVIVRDSKSWRELSMLDRAQWAIFMAQCRSMP